MTQLNALLNHLDKYGEITQKDAYDLFGIQRLSALIFNLKKDGYKFETEIKTGKTRYGTHSHYTIYKLIKE